MVSTIVTLIVVLCIISILFYLASMVAASPPPGGSPLPLRFIAYLVAGLISIYLLCCLIGWAPGPHVLYLHR